MFISFFLCFFICIFICETFKFKTLKTSGLWLVRRTKPKCNDRQIKDIALSENFTFIEMNVRPSKNILPWRINDYTKIWKSKKTKKQPCSTTEIFHVGSLISQIVDSFWLKGLFHCHIIYVSLSYFSFGCTITCIDR